MTTLTQAIATPSTEKRWGNRRRSHRVPPEPLKLDRFEYGWREVPRVNEKGEEVFDRQPLTLWDVLHPEAGDFRVHTDEHEKFIVYLTNVFMSQLADVPGSLVLADTRVAWAKREIIPHSPDISVIFNVTRKDNWATFDEVKEGTRPTLIVEIISPNTRRVDIIDKKIEYAEVGVDIYVIVDAKIRRGYTQYRINGYRLVNGQYEEMLLDEQGRLWLEPVQAWLGVRNNWLVCYDAEGELIGDYVQVSKQAKRAEKQVLLAEQRAAAEAQRAEVEAQRAEAEALARAEAERRITEMQAELERLRKLQRK